MSQFHKIFGSIGPRLKEVIRIAYKYEVLRFKKEGGGNFSIGIKPTKILLLNQMIEDCDRFGMGAYLEFYLASQIIGAGPKIMQPDRLNLEAAEEIDLNIGVADYKQPFDTMIVELPDDYGLRRAAYCPQFDAAHCPIFVAIHLDPYTGIIIIGVYYYKKEEQQQQVFSFGLVPVEGKTIEEELELCRTGMPYKGSLDNSLDENVMGFKVTRAALNILMFMYEFGTIKVGYENKSHASRLSRRVRKGNSQAEHELLELPVIYDFKQSVKLYKTERVINRESRSTDREMKPHWRRGHRRRQHYGVGNSLIKIVFIKPVLINSDKFSGDISETEVRYT